MIEIHIIRPLPAHLLNRGENGEAKDVYFGGRLRSRISPQARKHAMRRWAEVNTDSLKTVRSRHFVSALGNTLGSGKADALDVAKLALGCFGVSFEDDSRTANTLFLGADEIDNLQAVINQHRSEFDALLDKAAKDKKLAKLAPAKLVDHLPKDVVAAIRDAIGDSKAIHLALFGRMVAESPQHNQDGAAYVAHSFSVNAIRSQTDFFSAVDDLSERNAMIGERGLAAGSSYYEYIAIDEQQLADNLDADVDAMQMAFKVLLQSAIRALPSGAQHNHAAFGLPVFALVNRPPMALNLAGAFEKPVRAGDLSLSGEAVKALEHYQDRMYRFYQLMMTEKDAAAFNLTDYALETSRLQAVSHDSLDAFLAASLEVFRG